MEQAPAWEFRDAEVESEEAKVGTAGHSKQIGIPNRHCVSSRIVSHLTLADRWGIGCMQEAATWMQSQIPDSRFNFILWIPSKKKLKPLNRHTSKENRNKLISLFNAFIFISHSKKNYLFL